MPGLNLQAALTSTKNLPLQYRCRQNIGIISNGIGDLFFICRFTDKEITYVINAFPQQKGMELGKSYNLSLK